MLNSVFIKLFVQTVHFCALLEFPMFRWRNVTYRTHLCCNLTIHDVQSAINGRELVADGCCNMKQFQLSPREHLSVTPQLNYRDITDHLLLCAFELVNAAKLIFFTTKPDPWRIRWCK